MARAQELGQPADWLIRSQHNCNLADGGKLWDSVGASPVLGEITFILPGRADQKARQVKQVLRAKRMRLPGLDASLFFDVDEIRGAYVLAKKARPKTPVTLIGWLLPCVGSSGARAMASPALRRSGSACSEPWTPRSPFKHCGKNHDFCIRKWRQALRDFLIHAHLTSLNSISQNSTGCLLR